MMLSGEAMREAMREALAVAQARHDDPDDDFELPPEIEGLAEPAEVEPETE